MLIPNRELSQFARYLSVDDTVNRNIGIATTGTTYVGIGTTSPTSKFFVHGNTFITGILTASQIRGGSEIGISSGGNYVGLTTNINFVGSGITVNSQYNSTLGIATITFISNSGLSPGGDENQVQYYSNGTLAGSVNFTFNGTDVNIVGVTTASRFISTTSNGTSPISVASSTLVVNLNSNYLNGYTAVSPNTSNSIILRDDYGNFQAGVITATGFIGSIFDTGTSTITTLTNTNANLNRVNISGIVTVSNSPVLIGVGSSTGTQNQKLQVDGKSYFSDNVGIGSTNPNSKLSVVGDGAFTGVVTASNFIGNLNAVNLNATGISTFSSAIATTLTVSGSSTFNSSVAISGAVGLGTTAAKSGDIITFAGSAPQLSFVENGVSSNNSRWAISVNNEEMVYQAIDDSIPGTGGGNIIAIGRSGNELKYLQTRSANTGNVYFNFDFFTARIGIGTTNPQHQVEVSGDAKIVGQTNLKEIKETVFTLATSGSIALDPANGSIQISVLTGNPTFTDSMETGQSIVLMLENGSSYTVTWPSITWVSSSGNSAPVLTAKSTIVMWKVASTLYGAYVGSYV